MLKLEGCRSPGGPACSRSSSGSGSSSGRGVLGWRCNVEHADALKADQGTEEGQAALLSFEVTAQGAQGSSDLAGEASGTVPVRPVHELTPELVRFPCDGHDRTVQRGLRACEPDSHRRWDACGALQGTALCLRQ